MSLGYTVERFAVNDTEIDPIALEVPPAEKNEEAVIQISSLSEEIENEEATAFLVSTFSNAS